jgi:glycosyltransferase involved in cell wall biosynthesis
VRPLSPKGAAAALDNVELVGFIPQQELAYPAAGGRCALTSPPVGARRHVYLPLKLFDYIASGTPIVASRIPSLADGPLNDLIQAWYDPDQPQAFAASLAISSCRGTDRPQA